MQITHARNATMIVEAGGHRILVDPMLGAKASSVAAPTIVDNNERNPIVDLVTPLQDLLDVDLVVVTHTHPDHWDEAAASLLSRHLPILVQHRQDEEMLRAIGFIDVRVMEPSVTLGETTFTRVEGRHGSEEFLAANPGMGKVSGFVLTTPGEPSLYVAGDTVWHDCVEAALTEHTPDVVVLNTGGALWVEGDAIIMGAEDVLRTHRIAPSAQIVAVHMEALNHCTVSRAQVRELAAEHGISDRVHAPADGEKLTF